MCTAERIVVLAATSERQLVLRRAVIGEAWQVVAAVGDVDAVIDRLTALRGKVVVVDDRVDGAGTGEVAVRLRGAAPDVLLVGAGEVAGTDAEVDADGLDRLPEVLAHLLHARGDHTH